MRKALAALILLLSSHAWGAVAFVASTQCGGANGCTTATINTTGANFLIMQVSEFNHVPSTPTDSKGNTWTSLPNTISADTTNGRLFYSFATTVGTLHTFTIADTGDFPAIVVASFSGVPSPGSLDKNNQAANSNFTAQPGSITPTANNELIVSGYSSSVNPGGTPTINSSFNTAFGISFVGGTNVTAYMSYLIQGTAAAVNPTWTTINVALSVATIASFKGQTGNCAPCDMSGF